MFVFLDTVQFEKNEFQNRNRVPLCGAPRWLTVPVTFRFGDAIRAVRIAGGRDWRRKILGTLAQAYRRAPHAPALLPAFAELLGREWTDLASLNMATVRWLAEGFDLHVPLRLASNWPDLDTDRTRRLIDICRRVGATTYVSGAQARCYLDVAQFEAAGIGVEFQHFEHPRYSQVDVEGDFIPCMSALDALFNCGGWPGDRRDP